MEIKYGDNFYIWILFFFLLEFKLQMMTYDKSFVCIFVWWVISLLYVEL